MVNSSVLVLCLLLRYHLNLLLVSTYKKVSINARLHTFPRQLREGNFAEQCPSREVLKHAYQSLGRIDSGRVTRRYTPSF